MRALVFATVVLLSGLAAASAEPGSLAGKELRKAVSGRTVYLKTGWGVELPIAYRSNGTMTGRLKAFAAAMAGGNGQTDRGKWWISKDQLCQRWQHWLDGKAYCYKLARKDGTVRWTRNDGRSGTARIGG
ncbi:MAG: hypothetical protein MI824_12760 [Hyphomicrobiales bacterium]|nr:hypothetical protein [Hyphomicrobiales bacterium]